jgi:hypothetical protein
LDALKNTSHCLVAIESDQELHLPQVVKSPFHLEAHISIAAHRSQTHMEEEEA